MKSRPKLKRCPVCGCKPHYMSLGDTCGYIMCVICLRRTKRYDDLIESWKEQAAWAWNEDIVKG